MLFRTTDGELLFKKNNVWIDRDGEIFWGDLPYKAGVILGGRVVTKMFYDDIDEYKKDFPEEKCADYHFFGGREQTFLIQTYPYYRCITGSFLSVSIQKPGLYDPVYSSVLVNDGDDGYARKMFETFEEAVEEAEKLKLLAPFTMDELGFFGYQVE